MNNKGEDTLFQRSLYIKFEFEGNMKEYLAIIRKRFWMNWKKNNYIS